MVQGLINLCQSSILTNVFPFLFLRVITCLVFCRMWKNEFPILIPCTATKKITPQKSCSTSNMRNNLNKHKSGLRILVNRAQLLQFSSLVLSLRLPTLHQEDSMVSTSYFFIFLSIHHGITSDTYSFVHGISTKRSARPPYYRKASLLVFHSHGHRWPCELLDRGGGLPLHPHIFPRAATVCSYYPSEDVHRLHFSLLLRDGDHSHVHRHHFPCRSFGEEVDHESHLRCCTPPYLCVRAVPIPIVLPVLPGCCH